MSYFDIHTTTVELGGGNTATIAPIAYGISQDIKQKCMKIGLPMGGLQGQGMAEVDAVLMQKLTLHAWLKGWEGPDFDNRPCTPDNIDLLPVEIADKIVEAINALSAESELNDSEKNALTTHINGQYSTTSLLPAQ